DRAQHRAVEQLELRPPLLRGLDRDAQVALGAARRGLELDTVAVSRRLRLGDRALVAAPDRRRDRDAGTGPVLVRRVLLHVEHQRDRRDALRAQAVDLRVDRAALLAQREQLAATLEGDADQRVGVEG